MIAGRTRDRRKIDGDPPRVSVVVERFLGGGRAVRERKSRSRVAEIETTRVRADAPLARKASGEVLDELVLMEMEILRRYKAHLAAQTAAPSPSPEQARILRALRKLDD